MFKGTTKFQLDDMIQSLQRTSNLQFYLASSVSSSCEQGTATMRSYMIILEVEHAWPMAGTRGISWNCVLIAFPATSQTS